MATPYLFGGTQDQFTQAQQEANRNKVLQTAQLTPEQFGMFMSGQAGQRAGQAIGGMLGIQDPMIARFQRIKQAEQMTIASGISETDDPVNYYKEAAKNLLAVGEPELASQAASQVRGLKKELADIASAELELPQKRALTEQYTQTATESKQRTEVSKREEKEKIETAPLRRREAEAGTVSKEQEAEIRKFTVKWQEEDRKLQQKLTESQISANLARGQGKETGEELDPKKILGEQYRRRFVEWDTLYENKKIDFDTWQRGRDQITQTLQDFLMRSDLQGQMGLGMRFPGTAGGGGLGTLPVPTLKGLVEGKSIVPETKEPMFIPDEKGKLVPNPNFNKSERVLEETSQIVPTYKVPTEEDARTLSKTMEAAGKPFRIEIETPKEKERLLTPKDEGLLGDVLKTPPVYFDWVKQSMLRGGGDKSWIIDPPSPGRSASRQLIKAQELKGKRFKTRIEALEAIKKALE